MRPVCAKCGLEMDVWKNGIFVLYHDGNGDPYKLFSGDLWGCSSCQSTIVTGFGQNPVWASYESSVLDLEKLEQAVKDHGFPFIRVL